MYVPTNGRLMRREVIDRLADAGVATFNLAVDSVADRKELPKALQPIRSYFDYLIKKQYVYNFSVFFNINITRIKPGGRPAAYRNRSRRGDRDGLSHQRIAHARTAALQA